MFIGTHCIHFLHKCVCNPFKLFYLRCKLFFHSHRQNRLNPLDNKNIKFPCFQLASFTELKKIILSPLFKARVAHFRGLCKTMMIHKICIFKKFAYFFCISNSKSDKIRNHAGIFSASKKRFFPKNSLFSHKIVS